jgi:hypothetical protein
MSTAPPFGSDSRHESHLRSHWWSAGAPRLRRSHVIVAALAFVIILPVAYVAYCMATLPDNGGLVIEPTPSALIVEAPDGQVSATRGVFKGDKLSPQDIPANLSRAIIAIEDRHFYEHGGFYLPSMVRAAIRNIVFGSVREGGSTITQQLARMTYLSPERTIKRKIQEAILAMWMERTLGKEEILSRYLNTAYFGAGVYGVDAAAKRYFGKTAKELSLSESAMLAGLVRAPSALAPTRHLEGARQRAALVLNAMVQTGAISREQADAARRSGVSVSVAALNAHPAIIRLGRFGNFDRADVGEDVCSDVARHVVRQGSERPILVGTLDRNFEAPGVQRRAAFGANDGVQFRVLGGEIAERGDVAAKRHLHLTPALLAKERNGNVRHLKTVIIRFLFRMPDQLLSFLHAFFQASGIRSDLKGGGSIERHKFRILPARLPMRRHGHTCCKRNECRPTRQSDHLGSPKRREGRKFLK